MVLSIGKRDIGGEIGDFTLLKLRLDSRNEVVAHFMALLRILPMGKK